MIAFLKALLRTLPTPLAFHIVKSLASRTLRPPTYPDQDAAMLRAQRIQYGPTKTHTAWSWGSGDLVILIHGWNGRAAQLAPLATHLAEQGFRAVCIEITGHGDSPGNTTAWRYFVDDLALLVATLGEQPFALIGHSAGGLAMMAARKLRGVTAKRHVCICTPAHPYPPIRGVRQRLDPPERVMDRYREFIALQLGSSWRDIEAGSAFHGAEGELLLFYDESDKFVDHTDGDRIASWCPRSQLQKSTRYGHTRVLSAPELQSSVLEFLRLESAEQTPP